MRFVIVTHALLPNGPAQRLVGALEARGHEAALCGLPMLGSDHTRFETYVSGSMAMTHTHDVDQEVSWLRIGQNALELRRFFRSIARMGWGDACLIGCDGLSFVLASHLALGTVILRSRVVYFVDYSPQRLTRPVEGRLYKAVNRWAVAKADVTATITEEARIGFTTLLGSGAVGRMYILPNLPLPVRNDVPWSARPLRVVYLGGFRDEHGASLIGDVIGRTQASMDRPVEFHFAGEGPEYASVRDACGGLAGVVFHGTVESTTELSEILENSRVGLAPYDPTFPMFAYNSPLKIRDYLAAGLRVVTTWPLARPSEAISSVPYTAQGIAAGIAQALCNASAPNGHDDPLLAEGNHALDSLLRAVDPGRDDVSSHL